MLTLSKFSPKQLAILGGVASVLLIALYFIFTSPRSSEQLPRLTLTIWGTEPRGALEAALTSYHTLRPNVNPVYVEKNPATYSQEVINALASGKGPDIYMISNRALGMEWQRLAPADPTQYGIARLQAAFPDVVAKDFAAGGKVYALPLYLDTLALLYNKDSLNQAALVSPPVTWTDVQASIPHLRKLDANGQVVFPAAALGGSRRSVTHAADVLSALFLQNGAPMNDAALTAATFNGEQGLQAFNFYLQFANPQSPDYTWRDESGRDMDLFAGGKLALMFGYQSDVQALRARSPFLNFAAAPFPQLGGASTTVAFPRYTGLAVAKQSPAPPWAWDLVIYITTLADNSRAYLKLAARPPALRTLIGEAVNDPNLGVFARQALVAKSWYEGDPAATENILSATIADVLAGKTDSRRALQQAQDQISAILGGTR